MTKESKITDFPDKAEVGLLFNEDFTLSIVSLTRSGFKEFVDFDDGLLVSLSSTAWFSI